MLRRRNPKVGLCSFIRTKSFLRLRLKLAALNFVWHSATSLRAGEPEKATPSGVACMAKTQSLC